MAYLHNVAVTAVLNMTTPHEKLFGRAAFMRRLEGLGGTAYVHEHASQKSNKFDARAEKGVSIGNQDYMHRIYLPERKKLVTASPAAINEDERFLPRRLTGTVFVEKGYP